MDTFTWPPDWGATMKKTPKLNTAGFGDGYEQRAPTGLNFKLQTWELTFSNRTDTETGDIEAFLEAQGGWAAFMWDPISGGYVLPDYIDPLYFGGKLFKCPEWSRSFDGVNNNTIRATFQEVMA